MAAINRPKEASPIGSKSALPLITVSLLLAALTMLPASSTQGEDYAAVQSYIHAFNNNVTVYTEVFALNKEFSLNTSSYVKYTVDFIQPGLFESEDDDGDAVSSASSSAAGGGQDTRNELTAGISHNFPDLVAVELYYDYSDEKDYTSSTPTISLKKELFNKNTTLTLGYSRNMDDVSGRFMDSTQTRTTDNYYFGLTQIISPVTIVQAGYSRTESDGFQAEGIRLVPVDGVASSSCTEESATCLEEAFPESRRRNAYILGINHYFTEGDGKEWLGLKGLGIPFGRSSINLTFRYYDDDWDIESYTGEIAYYKYLSDNDIVRLNYRFYNQTASFFFKDDYLSSDALRSSSPQHRDFSTHLAGVKLTHSLNNRPSVGPVEMGGIEAKYEFYLESSRVQAHIVMASFRLLF
ncbi:MAG: DUF3570 domain-containing protein [Thermodesulfobacteriota bacterium]